MLVDGLEIVDAHAQQDKIFIMFDEPIRFRRVRPDACRFRSNGSISADRASGLAGLKPGLQHAQMRGLLLFRYGGYRSGRLLPANKRPPRSRWPGPARAAPGPAVAARHRHNHEASVNEAMSGNEAMKVAVVGATHGVFGLPEEGAWITLRYRIAEKVSRLADNNARGWVAALSRRGLAGQQCKKFAHRREGRQTIFPESALPLH